MGKKLTDRERLIFKLDHLSDTDVHEVLEYVSIMESMKPGTSAEQLLEDEVLTLLASALENRRARQVYEWESARRHGESTEHHARA